MSIQLTVENIDSLLTFVNVGLLQCTRPGNDQ